MLRAARGRAGGRRALAGLAAGALVGLGCQQTNPPVVKQQTFSTPSGALAVVAVMPFYPRPELARSLAEDVDPEEVAARMTSIFATVLAQEDVRVVPPSDVELAFSSQDRATPRRDPKAAGEVVAREFGATSLVLGEVYRWRERRGQSYGADTPASVGYVVSLFDVRGGRRLWTSRFDHTQRTLTADPLTARKYPGGGTRWLTTAELARWGARAAAASLVEGQWRRPSS